ncbi:fatty acid synthase-like isoform X2 [Bradysia coprophila]|nr:fatty acid synthase-like isoform X2 [Bradysia coprophila]
MHPQIRCLLEHAVEAVYDAGIHPNEIAGKRVGVFSAASDFEQINGNNFKADAYSIIGGTKSVVANLISQFLDLKGPSMTVDSACSSSMMALQCAYNAMMCGECVAAIVTGSNLVLTPNAALQMTKLGMLSPDGYSRVFDEKASGYVKSEAVVAIFIQKYKDARRCYAKIVHLKSGADGKKPDGPVSPYGAEQQKLMELFYDEIKMSPNVVQYVEAHSTGTSVGDPQECNAILNAFCKDRSTALLIGSVKSNMGHSENSAGLSSIVKSILTFETGTIAPNIHFDRPNKNIIGLNDGRLKIVLEKTEFPGSFIALNCFGVGGANGHALLQKHSRIKSDHKSSSQAIPALVFWSSRTEQGCRDAFTYIANHRLDREFIGLIHKTQSWPMSEARCRSYAIFEQRTDEITCTLLTEDIVQVVDDEPKRPVVWIFPGMGCQWLQMGLSLMSVAVFNDAIKQCHRALEVFDINLMHILTSDRSKVLEDVVESFVGIVSIQIGLVNLLKALGVEPDFILGHSAGEICCGYADGCLTLEQTILIAYFRGKAFLETEIIDGAMASVGIGYKKIQSMLPKKIEVACRNGPDSCTISGPADDVHTFMEQLTSQGIFVKEVASLNIPYHSSYIRKVGCKFQQFVEAIILSPKSRTSKWLSTSIPNANLNNGQSNVCSAEYQTNNLVSPVLFEEAMAQLPPNSLTIELAPFGLLQAILRKGMPDAMHVTLTKMDHLNDVQPLLQGLGKMYNFGVDMNIDKLYSPVEFPVSLGTPMISPIINAGWDHKDDWFVPHYEEKQDTRSSEQKYKIVLSSDDHSYLLGHKVNGAAVMPVTGYIVLVMQTFANIMQTEFSELSIKMSDVKCVANSIKLLKDTLLQFVITLTNVGYFEVVESGTLLMSGHIEQFTDDVTFRSAKRHSAATILESNDCRKALRLKGYQFDEEFASSVREVSVFSEGTCGRVKMGQHFETFLEGCFQIVNLAYDSYSAFALQHFESAVINMKKVNQLSTMMWYEKECKTLHGVGIEITGIEGKMLAENVGNEVKPLLESYSFIPYHDTSKAMGQISVNDKVYQLFQIVTENINSFVLNILEICPKDMDPLLTHIQSSLARVKMIIAEFYLATERECADMDDVTTINLDELVRLPSNMSLVIGSGLCGDLHQFKMALKICKDHAFVISREASNFEIDSEKILPNVHVVSTAFLSDFTLIMFEYRIRNADEKIDRFINVTNSNLEWLKVLKGTQNTGRIYLIVQYEQQFSGIVGFVNCLRKEAATNVYCVLIEDPQAPKFDPEIPMYKKQLEKNLVMNIYRHGTWGAFRFTELESNQLSQPQSKYCYMNYSDHLAWHQMDVETAATVKVQYLTLNREYLNSLIEYSGTAIDGQQVFGIVNNSKMLVTHVNPEPHLTWIVPEFWNLKQAVTVAVPYLTIYYTYFELLNVQRGATILIQTSEVMAIAAIQTAEMYNLKWVAVVDSIETKESICATFSFLNRNRIRVGNSPSLHKMIMQEIDSEGVDYVLCSSMCSSVKSIVACLKKDGQFLHITSDERPVSFDVDMRDLNKEIRFYTTSMHDLINAPSDVLKQLNHKLQRDIDNGMVLSFKSKVFAANQIQNASQELLNKNSTNRKIVIQVREQMHDVETLPVPVWPTVLFKPNSVYIVIGGLGGIGLELSNWMIKRGCRKLVLCSRNGIKNSYQEYRVNQWKLKGVEIHLNSDKITAREGCQALLNDAKRFGSIGGIFHLAVIVHDKLLDNQSFDHFSETFAVKAMSTEYLDELTRIQCPNLEHFVAFTSVANGRGSPGQTAYALANSVMERFVENRVNCGYSGKAIQWGPVADVGLIAVLTDMDGSVELGGVSQQRISSCLQVLDVLLSCSDPIVSSIVIAEKHGFGKTLQEFIMNMFAIKGNKSSILNKTLSELGMDSLEAMEIVQRIEVNYDMVVPVDEIRNLTIQALMDFVEGKAEAK